jgi:nucleoside-diphosphate-sugar epimerase
MRKVLILGGTGWLGGAIARAALERGDAVTCLARGRSGAMPPGVTAIVADRAETDAYARVADSAWHEVIELSSDPVLVRGALVALAARAVHWTFISTVSVYASDAEPDATEAAATTEPGDEQDYAAAKVACERATTAALGDRALIVRPGLIVGAGDPSDRFGYWVARFALAGAAPVVTPDSADRFAQVIDLRDLAAFVVDAGARGVTGVINAVGHPQALGELLDTAAEVAGFRGQQVPLADAVMLDKGVAYWAGPRSLPLWLPVEASGFARRSNAAYLAAGGRIRPLRETLTATLDDERSRGLERERRAGLTRHEELELLDILTENGVSAVR